MNGDKTRTIVKMEWIKDSKYYLMQSPTDIAIQEIPEDDNKLMRFLSCLFVLLKFKNINKVRPQKYRITIEHLGEA